LLGFAGRCEAATKDIPRFRLALQPSLTPARAP